MERTSLITHVLLTDSTNFPLLTLGSDGHPSEQNLVDFFMPIPLIIERADMKESLEDTDQGDLLDITIRINTHREAKQYLSFPTRKVLAYVQTANGETHLIGTQDNPLTLTYATDSGATNTDSRDNTIVLNQKAPV